MIVDAGMPKQYEKNVLGVVYLLVNKDRIKVILKEHLLDASERKLDQYTELISKDAESILLSLIKATVRQATGR